MSASEENETAERTGTEEHQATSSPVLVTDLAHKTLAVKEGDVFLYSDREGNLEEGVNEGLGLYASDTRFLSRFRMRVSGRDPVLLSSSSERAYMSHVDLTNPDLFVNGMAYLWLGAAMAGPATTAPDDAAPVPGPTRALRENRRG